MKVAIVTDSPFLCEKTMYLGELEQEMKARGVTVDLLPILATPWSTLEGKISVQRLLKTSLLIPTIRKYDLVHVQFTFPSGFLLSLFKSLHGKPVIIHTHGDDVFVVPSASIGFRRAMFGRFATWFTWQTTSHIIAVCKRARAEIVKAGVPQTKISVLYNGVNEVLFSRWNLGENRFVDVRESSDFVFLNVGGLKEVKNQARLLAAFSSYVKDSGSKSSLVICGAGQLDEALFNLARKLNIDERVIFLGRVPHGEMPQLYSAVDAYVLPSLHEAHPWSILEAMSCELPVAASNVGGIPETINNEKLLINPWKADDIQQAMYYLAENPKRSRMIGTQNRRVVVEKFTLRQHAIRLESIYRRV